MRQKLGMTFEEAIFKAKSVDLYGKSLGLSQGNGEPQSRALLIYQ
jgi:hypothetical protein